MSSGISIAVECLSNESRMGFSQTHQSSVVTLDNGSSLVTPQAIRDWLMSLPADSPASHSVAQAKDSEQTTPETCGPPRSMPFASFDRDSVSWRTSQLSLLSRTSELFSETWPKAGMVCAGAAYRLRKWERRIIEIGSGYVPTPRANENGDYQYDRGDKSKPRPTLAGWVKMWPTPRASDGMISKLRSKNTEHKGRLEDAIALESPGGYLSPMWVEWLMGWPIGWTGLEPLGMDKFQQWLQQHGIC